MRQVFKEKLPTPVSQRQAPGGTVGLSQQLWPGLPSTLPEPAPLTPLWTSGWKKGSFGANVDPRFLPQGECQTWQGQDLRKTSFSCKKELSLQRAWTYQRTGPSPASPSAIPVTSIQTGTGIIIVAIDLWEAKTQTEGGTGASGAFAGY